MNFKNDLIEYIWLLCDKNSQRKFDQQSQERFFNTYKFSNHGNNKFILLLQKMDNWERFNETLLLEKEDFHIHLNIKDVIDADYAHGKRVCKDFK